ncbi:MAG TPA: ABC transporter permease [Candidatus Omnitrophota bacterium]|nr:ABC transporter permease [Candidatus Omnitrophota bacterium]
MSTFTKIAWRNITRNQYRSSLTVSAVAIGLASLIFLKGFTDGADMQMVENYTNLLIGSIQVHKTGFNKNMGLEKSITSPDTLLSSVRNIPGVKAVSTRVKDFALISSPESSAGIMLYGIDPLAERRLSTMNQRLRRGRFLTRDDKDKIIIGKDLSSQLKADLGDKVVLMSQGADGSMAAAAYEVCGIMEAGSEEIDKNLAIITIEAAQELLVLGSKISEIAVAVTSLDDIDEIAGSIKAKINTEKYEVLTWKEISPMTYQWLQFDQVFTALILFIVLLVVAAGILNTVLMSVLERTREFGIMLALGTKPQQITSMVATESIILGGIGIIFGACLGAGLVLLFGMVGINLSVISHALNSFYIGSIVYTRLDIQSLIIYSGVVLLTSVLISIYPAKKASKLSPIEAIRHI